MRPNEQKNYDFSEYLSPFTWRYGSKDMREIFSEVKYRVLWREIWVSLAKAQSKFGLVSEAEVMDLKSKSKDEDINLSRAHQIEKEIRHDLMAEVKTFAEQCPIGGGKIHLGTTSADIEDNADILRVKNALELILSRLINCLNVTKKNIEKYKDVKCMGWTHLQPAEPTTVGYRLANYAQDLVMDIQYLEEFKRTFLKGKGIKGAVGTSASLKEILYDDEKVIELEKNVLKSIGIEAFPISTQTYPRKVDFVLLSLLSSIAQSLYRFALDLRHLQSPPYGELSEPIGKTQVGSSTMPAKRNPVSSERICSLGRYISRLPGVAWENASQTIFERTLDDSANRRVIIPESFLAIDECLILYVKLMEGIEVYPSAIKNNLDKYSPFSLTEAVLMKAVESGGNRQEIHEKLRMHSAKMWKSVLAGGENTLIQELKSDSELIKFVTVDQLEELRESNDYIGLAVQRCDNFIETIVNPIILKYENMIEDIIETPF